MCGGNVRRPLNCSVGVRLTQIRAAVSNERLITEATVHFEY